MTLGRAPIQRIKVLWEWLGLLSASLIYAIRKKYGINSLRKAYRENLRIVLEHVVKLCDELLRHKPSARIVITSDHTELLGEIGKYSHGIKNPYTLEVPWLRVKNVKRNLTYRDTNFYKTKTLVEHTKAKIEKLKKLGKI